MGSGQFFLPNFQDIILASEMKLGRFEKITFFVPDPLLEDVALHAAGVRGILTTEKEE